MDSASTGHGDRQPELIIIGIHGVGSPPIGEIANAVSRGFIRARGEGEFRSRGLSTSIQCAAETGDPAQARVQIYEGRELTSKAGSVHVWEVNWADLKGFPVGVVGTLVYALKMVIAMIQISDTGWRGKQGPTGPLRFGLVLRFYFCAVSLIAPIGLLLIAFASIATHLPTAATIAVLSMLIVLSAVIYSLRRVDLWLLFSLFPLWLFGCVAFWITWSPNDDLLKCSIRLVGWIEGLLGLILLFALIELLFRWIAPGKDRVSSTIFIARAGVMILGATFGVAAYGAIVNACGFYILNKLKDLDLVTEGAIGDFNRTYLATIPYDVALMEFINAGTTFLVGVFLVGGVVYQFLRISGSRNDATDKCGLAIQNTVRTFLWLSLFGFLLVLACTFIDLHRAFVSADDATLSLMGALTWPLQWLNQKIGTWDDPLKIYSISAVRVVPFLFPILVPSLRAGMNAAADVLLYILPPQFGLSLSEAAQLRFRRFFDAIVRRHPAADVLVVAHSQGTVIVYDSFESVPPAASIGLLTAGSPLGALYNRFLGTEICELRGCAWRNVFRYSDYIAGPLSLNDRRDWPLKRDYRDAHFCYFDEGVVISQLLDLRPSFAGLRSTRG